MVFGVVVCKGIHSRSDTEKIEAKNFIIPNAVLPESDVGGNSVELVLGFVNQNNKTLCSL